MFSNAKSLLQLGADVNLGLELSRPVATVQTWEQLNGLQKGPILCTRDIIIIIYFPTLQTVPHLFIWLFYLDPFLLSKFSSGSLKSTSCSLCVLN